MTFSARPICTNSNSYPAFTIFQDKVQESWDWKNFSQKMAQEKIQYRIWGRSGEHWVGELESKLNFKFNEELKYFITHFGNLDIGSDDIILTGSETRSCVSESKHAGLFEPTCLIKGVKIMDRNGVSYILLEDGSINQYDYKSIEPRGELAKYKSLTHLVENIIKEIKEGDS